MSLSATRVRLDKKMLSANSKMSNNFLHLMQKYCEQRRKILCAAPKVVEPV
jgi:hypothetical protein